MIDNLENQSAAEIGRRIAKGSLDPLEAAEFFLDRIERDRKNPSFILVTRTRALDEAEASRKRHREGRAAGPLDGVPIAWKDLVDMAGERTPAGSALYADSPPKESDAPIVENLDAAGMVALGKTNLRNSPSRRLGSIRISGRREIRVIPRRRALREDPRQAPRSRLPAALRLARLAATPAVRSARPPVSAALSGLRPARGGSTSRACFPFHVRSTRSARWRTRSRIAC